MTIAQLSISNRELKESRFSRWRLSARRFRISNRELKGAGGGALPPSQCGGRISNRELKVLRSSSEMCRDG